jgi:hypothetical protein
MSNPRIPCMFDSLELFFRRKLQSIILKLLSSGLALELLESGED